MTKQKQSNLEHVIASDQRERRNRNIGEIQRLCDYDGTFVPRNDNTSTRHCEEGKRSAVRRSNPLSECEKLFREHAPALLPLSFRNNISHINHYGTSQSLMNSNHFTHLRKRFATQIIRGAAKARFCRTLRAGLADARTAPYRKFGFTLAEVLITLGVIGIVAAMTIPTLLLIIKKKLPKLN